MSKPYPNQMVFIEDNYSNKQELMADIIKTVESLMKNKYMCLVRFEDAGIYVVDYCYDPLHTDFGSDRFVYMTAEEHDDLEFKREHPYDHCEWCEECSYHKDKE